MLRNTSRGASALLLASVLASGGCRPRAEDRAAARSEILVRRLMDAQQNADTALILELFWPDATYEDYPNQLEYQGIDEIVGYVTSAHVWGDDVYVNVGRVHPSEGGAAAEWLFSAVQNRPMGDLVPVATGHEVLLSGVTIIELRGDRIIRAADYTDTAPLALQLGGRIEMPGGTVLELEDRR